MRITYVGHATVRIESAAARVLTDPVLRDRLIHLRRVDPAPEIAALGQPDVVLISHAHFDHLDLPSLRLLRPRTTLVPRGCARLARRAGMTDVIEVAPGQELRLGPLGIRAVLLDHDGRRHPASKARETLGYVIDAGPRAFVAGDSALFEGLRELAGEVDVALLPVAGWGPRLGAGHMGPADAARAAAWISPRIAIPIHWGTLASRRASWRADPRRPTREFAERVAQLAPRVDVRILDPGESTEVG
jgi:L-ascorbate metabolism protein UlaG (beta-lactamase superfamily)